MAKHSRRTSSSTKGWFTWWPSDAPPHIKAFLAIGVAALLAWPVVDVVLGTCAFNYKFPAVKQAFRAGGLEGSVLSYAAIWIPVIFSLFLSFAVYIAYIFNGVTSHIKSSADNPDEDKVDLMEVVVTLVVYALAIFNGVFSAAYLKVMAEMTRDNPDPSMGFSSDYMVLAVQLAILTSTIFYVPLCNKLFGGSMKRSQDERVATEQNTRNFGSPPALVPDEILDPPTFGGNASTRSA